MKRIHVLTLCAGAAVALFAVACFQAPNFFGPFGCTGDEACGGAGFVCSDGICCRPRGDPLCLTYVFPDGGCADGGTAQTYYEDLDGDGFGNENNPKAYCGVPRYDKVSTVRGDCNDNPSASGELSFPGAKEQCDGRDNNCDGVFDEGLSLKPFYRDADGDSYGDKDAMVMACAPPVGYVDNALDCDPQRQTAHPGAPELCNGLDDDCDMAVDEQVSGFGQPCQHPTAKGLCSAGLTACVNGATACNQVVQPAPDYCDGLDNDCDGVADDAPDCGGPNLFLGDPGTQQNVKRLAGDPLSGVTGTCKADAPAFAGTADTLDSATVWRGVGPQTHIFWAERKGNDYWDLSRPGIKLRLAFDILSVNTNGPYAWDEHNQPVILLCGESGMVRLVHNAKILQDQRSGTAGQLYMLVPVNPAPNTEWVVGVGSANPDAVLRRVKRIEVLIQPEGTAVDFAISFTKWGIP